MENKSILELAGLCAFASAGFHVIALIVGGFGPDADSMIFGTIAWLALGMGLARNMRWVGYLAFLFGLFGSIAAMSIALGGSHLPSWALWLIVLADIGVILLTFGAIWKDKSIATGI